MDYREQNEFLFKQIEKLIRNKAITSSEHDELYEWLIDLDAKCWQCTADLKSVIDSDKDFLREIYKLQQRSDVDV